MDENTFTQRIVNSSFRIHKHLDPGLLESVNLLLKISRKDAKDAKKNR